jgi:hypothetical protein
MDLIFLLVILILWGSVCYWVSTFFEDRKVGKETIFIVSLILSPLIGILIGMSSERIKVQKKSVIPNYKSKSFKLNKELNDLEEKLKDIQKKRDLGIEPDDFDEIEKMKKRYVEIENLLKLQEGQKEKLQNYNHRNIRERKI